MSASPGQIKIMLALDRLSWPKKHEVEAICLEKKLSYNYFVHRIKHEDEEAILAVCEEVFAKYRKTDNFKIGDKVYVVPDEPAGIDYYIRATITEITKDWGYHARAFKEDLPGIFMFNLWDEMLEPRKGRKVRKVVKK